MFVTLFVFLIVFLMLGYVAVVDYNARMHGCRSSNYITASDFFTGNITGNSKKVRFDVSKLSSLFKDIFKEDSCKDVSSLEKYFNEKLNDTSSCEPDFAYKIACLLFIGNVLLAYVFGTLFNGGESGSKTLALSLASSVLLYGNGYLFVIMVSKYFAGQRHKFLSEWKEALFNDVTDEALTSVLVKLNQADEVMECIVKMQDNRNGKNFIGADVILGVIELDGSSKERHRQAVQKLIKSYAESK